MANTKKLMTGIISAAVILSGCSSQDDYDVITKSSSDDDVAPSVNALHKPETVKVEEITSNNQEESIIQEVELEHLKERYPDLDMNAMEDYMEKNNMEINEENEEELLAFLDDIQENGEPTNMENQYASSGSSFPWWLFLLMNNRSGSSYNQSSGISAGGANRAALSKQPRPVSPVSSGNKNTVKTEVPQPPVSSTGNSNGVQTQPKQKTNPNPSTNDHINHPVSSTESVDSSKSNSSSSSIKSPKSTKTSSGSGFGSGSSSSGS